MVGRRLTTTAEDEEDGYHDYADDNFDGGDADATVGRTRNNDGDDDDDADDVAERIDGTDFAHGADDGDDTAKEDV